MNKTGWIVLIIELLIFIGILGTVMKVNYDKIDLLEHNLETQKESLNSIKLENGELLSIQQSLIASKSELYDELNITKSDIKKLEKTLNNKIAYIAKLEAQVDLKDTVWMKPDTVYLKDNNNTIKNFTWNDDWAYIKSSIYGSTIQNSKLSITALNINVPLEIGLTEDYDFWAKTSNPYITFTNIQSGIIDGSPIKAKDKRFHHGIYGGFGFNYGLFGKTWDFGPQFGYGFMYSF